MKCALDLPVWKTYSIGANGKADSPPVFYSLGVPVAGQAADGSTGYRGHNRRYASVDAVGSVGEISGKVEPPRPSVYNPLSKSLFLQSHVRPYKGRF